MIDHHYSDNGQRSWILVWFVFVASVLAIPITTVLAPESSYPSRQQCWLYHPILTPLHDITNSGIWIEYIMIPALFLWVGWRSKAWRLAQSFPILGLLGCNFVFWCGATHLTSRVEIYKSSPWLSGVVLVICLLAGMVFIGDFVRKSSRIVRWFGHLNRASELVSELERLEQR